VNNSAEKAEKEIDNFVNNTKKEVENMMDKEIDDITIDDITKNITI
jgi:hypothetical protein